MHALKNLLLRFWDNVDFVTILILAPVVIVLFDFSHSIVPEKFYPYASLAILAYVALNVIFILYAPLLTRRKDVDHGD